MANNYSRIVSQTDPGTSASVERKLLPAAPSHAGSPGSVIAESPFHATLTLERRRAERSRKPFVLMLVDATLANGSSTFIMGSAVKVIFNYKRETDIVGWYRDGSIAGTIFTELGRDGEHSSIDVLRAKMQTAFTKHLGRERASLLTISMHVFPESWDRNQSGWEADSKLYPDLCPKSSRKRLPLAIKRAIDVAGSLALLLVLSPLLAIIAAAIKLTSKGPVIFEQERLGHHGVRFKCLKFRTMYDNNDPRLHQEYIQQFIAGAKEAEKAGQAQASVYKIVDDPRVTSVGRLLRKGSLDELPQFWNVLRGEMSLVGPRPPVPYEFEIYDVWHRRRVLEIKPGVTGLWQVSGRSRTKFDDMVRLDLRYCQTWSLWLDLKILAATPRAVFSGDGAY